MAGLGAGTDFYNILTSVSTTLVAYTFLNNLFPIFSGLKNKNNNEMSKTTAYSLGLVFTIYTFLSIVCLMIFGKSCNQGTDMMNSVNQELLLHPERKEAFFLQILFMIVLACHIPFIFFSGKEALCIIVDEIDRRSVSSTLDERIE